MKKRKKKKRDFYRIILGCNTFVEPQYAINYYKILCTLGKVNSCVYLHPKYQHSRKNAGLVEHCVIEETFQPGINWIPFPENFLFLSRRMGKYEKETMDSRVKGATSVLDDDDEPKVEYRGIKAMPYIIGL